MTRHFDMAVAVRAAVVALTVTAYALSAAAQDRAVTSIGTGITACPAFDVVQRRII